MTLILEIRDLRIHFGRVRAVDGVSFGLPTGPFGLGLVGESGSGKSTIGRAIVRLGPAVGGRVLFEGHDVLHLRGRSLKEYRRDVQIVFQDPDNSLDPRMRIGATIGEVLTAHGIVPRRQVSRRVEELLQEVALNPEFAGRFPHQLSGGQRQRVAIARALAVGPQAVVLDEPTSAVDVTAQARILALIKGLRDEHKLAYLLITHNLAVVSELCEATVVLYLGKVAESGPTGELLLRPAHPYTKALRSAVPELDSAARTPRIALTGEPPSATAPPPGCVFHPRCPLCVDRCRAEVPILREVEPNRMAACHRAEEVLGGIDLSSPASVAATGSAAGGRDS
jgi:oligopeptide/dipeptide ABC transporter ATP-binding protein